MTISEPANEAQLPRSNGMLVVSYTAPDVAVAADRAQRTDELASLQLRACTDCPKRKPLEAFQPIRGTPYFYGRCLECRARRKRERYHANPVVRAAEIARSMRTKRRKQASKRGAVERPPPERVIEAVAAASGVPSWMLFSPRRSPNLAKPRAAALYLLRQEAGLRAEDVARLTGRKRETVHRATQEVAVAVGHDKQLADLIRRAQRLLASPYLNGRAYDPPPWSRSVGLLPGLETSRIAAGLTKRELARRSGITAETLIRIERL